MSNPLEPAAAVSNDAPAVETPLDAEPSKDVQAPTTEAKATGVEGSSDNPVVSSTEEVQIREDGSVDFAKYAPEGDEERYSKLNNKFKDHGSLAKSYLELQSMLSKDKMVLPTEQDGNEVWGQAYKALGHPDTPDGYDIPDVFDKDTGGAIASALHEAGIGKRQASKLINFLAEGVNQEAEAGQEQQNQSAEAAIKALEADVGPRNSQEYKQALDKAKIVAQHLGLNDSSYWLQAGFASKLASNYDNLVSSGFKGQVDTSISTGQGLEQQMDDIMSNPDNPWYTRYREGDRAAHAKVQALADQLWEIKNGKADI